MSFCHFPFARFYSDSHATFECGNLLDGFLDDAESNSRVGIVICAKPSRWGSLNIAIKRKGGKVVMTELDSEFSSKVRNGDKNFRRQLASLWVGTCMFLTAVQLGESSSLALNFLIGSLFVTFTSIVVKLDNFHSPSTQLNTQSFFWHHKTDLKPHHSNRTSNNLHNPNLLFIPHSRSFLRPTPFIIRLSCIHSDPKLTNALVSMNQLCSDCDGQEKAFSSFSRVAMIDEAASETCQ